MRRSWLSRMMGRADLETVRNELSELAVSQDWATVWPAAQEALAEFPDDPTIVALAARARLELATADDLTTAVPEVLGWLDPLLRRTSVDGMVLFVRGLAEWRLGRAEAADGFWQRAWQAKREATVGEALVRIWLTAGSLPEWGVPVVETALASG